MPAPHAPASATTPPTSEAAIRPPIPGEDLRASSPPVADPDFAGVGDEPGRGGDWGWGWGWDDWVWDEAAAGLSDALEDAAEEDALAEDAAPAFGSVVVPDEGLAASLAADAPELGVAGFGGVADAPVPAVAVPAVPGLAASPDFGAAEAACAVVAADALTSGGFVPDAGAPDVVAGLGSPAFAEVPPAEAEPGFCSPGFDDAAAPALPVPEPEPGVAGLDDPAVAEEGVSPAFPAFTSLASRSIVTGLRCEPPAGAVAPLDDAVFGSGFLLSAAMDGLSLAVMRPSVRAFRRRGGLACPASL